MPLLPIPFGLQTYQDRSKPVSAQDMVNVYAAQKQDGSKARVVLQSTPGLKLWKSVGSGPIRALQRFDSNRLFVVSGGELYDVDGNKNATLRGSVDANAVDCVPNARNATDAVFVDESTVYYANATQFGALAPGFTISDVAHQDGYLAVIEANTQKWFVSDLLASPPSWPSTDFIAANSQADNVVALASSNRNMWVFGEKSTQIYTNTGAAAFPFALIPNGVFNIGIIGRHAKASIEDKLLWVGDDYRVYLSPGLAPRIVSTDVIEDEIETAQSPSSCKVTAYKQFGHTFFVLNFFDKCLVFDLTTGLWHKRKSRGFTTSRTGWRGQSYAEFASKRLVGSVDNGDIYELDLATYDEVGHTIVRTLTSGSINQEMRLLTMNRFIVDFETGVGLNNGQGSSPQVSLQVSDDGGRSWGNEQWRSLGPIGAYHSRVYWDRLGSFRDRTIRLRISDPVAVTAISAYADIEAGEI